jgi:cytochrome c556
MKSITVLTTGCAMLMLGVAVAQEGAPHLQAFMKTIAGANGALRKAVTDKDAAQVSANAQKTADAFAKVQSHLEEDHLTDGVNFAKTAHKASMDLIAAANAGDWDKASDQLKVLGGTCQGCHTQYREKLPDGTFRMKHQ